MTNSTISTDNLRVKRVRITGLALAFLLLQGAASPKHGFEPFANEDGVTIELAKGHDKHPWVRGTTIIEAPAAKIASVLTDFPLYGETFSMCFDKATVLERGNGTRLHIVWRYPFFLKNRDSVVTYRSRKLPNGDFILSWKGDARPGDPTEGVRLDNAEGDVLVRAKGADRSEVVYTYIGDVGGDFSIGAKEAAWKKEPLHYFESIRKAVQPKTK